MLALLKFVFSSFIFFLLFCIAYVMGKKTDEEKPKRVLDKSLALMTIAFLGVLLFIVNIPFLINLFSSLG